MSARAGEFSLTFSFSRSTPPDLMPAPNVIESAFHRGTYCIARVLSAQRKRAPKRVRAEAGSIIGPARIGGACRSSCLAIPGTICTIRLPTTGTSRTPNRFNFEPSAPDFSWRNAWWLAEALTISGLSVPSGQQPNPTVSSAWTSPKSDYPVRLRARIKGNRL